ncbi:expansin EXLX1 family cellulose-binding protein [Micromonospora sp. LH3U1]|uniref:expansin EXLX1 family cellulose-binding protein n=1 Tax=Micromonospora sp. LH3U1 TaxID=3018339 RepID=UPI002349832C|nr:expansin EXLX1 family cellulose-binding protein [Micromonospora sp. LH3U1]WCN80138.1 expansin EXLX1 family cellulose-binding protein [Micromonospora sp. LH3U1]
MTAPGTDSENDTPAGDSGTHRPNRRIRHWLAGAGVAALAAVLGITLAVRSGATPACAAPPTGNTVHKAKASFYDAGRSGGNCSFPSPPADRLYVALGSSAYSGAAACGSYLDVTGPKGTVRVMVMDQCAGCGPGKIDLSDEAFAKIADRAQGIAQVTYRAVVSPPLDGGLTFRMKAGASQWWFAVQVGNHGNPLRSVEAQGPGGGFRKAARQNDNYWTVEGGLGPGPYSIKVTDVYGRQATAATIRMIAKQVQPSTVFLTAPTPSSSPSAPPTPTIAPSPTPAESVAPATTVEARAGAAPLNAHRC